jgi:hypothetical protein
LFELLLFGLELLVGGGLVAGGVGEEFAAVDADFS